jgi:hypothetical protein
MPASSRKLAEGFYGGHQPRDVALAVALGVLAGALTGLNVSWTVVFVAAIALNVHTRLFLAVWLASLLLALLSRDSLVTVGRLMLDGTPLGETLSPFGDSVALALLGFDQYVVLGGVAVGSILALLGAVAFYRITIKLNQHWQAVSSVETTENASRDKHQAQSAERALVCLWYGASDRERQVRREASPQRLRCYGIPTATAASLALMSLSWSMAGWLAERELWRQFSAFNGAEVAAEHTELSLWNGEFIVRELHVADPQDAHRDRVRIGIAKGKLSPGLLLRGHLDVEKLLLDRLSLGAARRTPARLDRVAAAAAPAYQTDDAVLRANDLKLDNYVHHWPLVSRQLASLGQVVAAIEQLSRAEDIGPLAATARFVGRRSELGSPRPWVAVRHLRTAELASGWNLGRKSLVELKELSSNPTLSKHATELKAILPKFGAEVQLTFSLKNGGAPHVLRCSACDLDLTQLAEAPSAGGLLSIARGRAKLLGEGVFDRQRLDLQLRIDVESLTVEATGEEALAGIDPALWSAGFARLGSFHTEVVLGGPWTSPRLTADRGRVVSSFQQQLGMVGATDLVDAIEQQLALKDEQSQEPFVMQATALEPQTEVSPSDNQPWGGLPRPPGPHDGVGSQGLQAEPDAPIEPAADHVANVDDVELNASNLTAAPSYPTTSMSDDEPIDPPATVAVAAQAPPVVRRPLPGPVNMKVGRDPYSSVPSSPADIGRRSAGGKPAQGDNALSRWSRGLREKLGQAFAAPSSTDKHTSESVVQFTDEPQTPPRRPIPAAASNSWYNQRWR